MTSLFKYVLQGLKSLILVVVVWLHGSPTALMIGQCGSTTSVPILDFSSSDISFNIGGLIQPSMDVPGQGLCSVDLVFRHDQISDVSMTLISPSGDEVRLVGEPTNGDQTELSEWDISFVRCGDAAIPDPGQFTVWSNLSPWSILANYTGSYYPNQGCLEDFTGSANGQWTLSIYDHREFDEGELIEVRLNFCDARGLDCALCLIDAGKLNTETMFICEGENTDTLDLNPHSFVTPIDTDVVYKYILSDTEVDEILAIADTFLADSLSPGHFLICGMAIHAEDTSLLPMSWQGINTDSLRRILQDSFVCFDITDDCTPVIVNGALPDTILFDTICLGESLSWYNMTLDTAGSYTVEDLGYNGCLRNYTLELFVLDLSTEIMIVDDFGCDSDTARLGVEHKTIWPRGTSWNTIGGTILGGNSPYEIIVEGDGMYIYSGLHSLSNGRTCSIRDTIELSNSFRLPAISYVVDTFTCAQPEQMITAIVSPFNSTVVWRGNNGLDTALTYLAQIGEVVELIAISPSDCVDSVTVSTVVDTTSPLVFINDTEKTCANDFVTFNNPVNAGDILEQWWVLPDGDTVRSDQVNTDQLGSITLCVIANNGCIRCDDALISVLGGIPDIQLLGDTLDCLSNGIEIDISIDGGYQTMTAYQNGTLIATTSPFTTSDTSAILIEMITPIGCRYDTLWHPIVAVDDPDITILTDTIDCNLDSVSILGVDLGEGHQYEWLGPCVSSSTDSIAYASCPGQYTLTLTTRVGCVLYDTVEVLADLATIDGIINGNHLDCLTDSAILHFSSNEMPSDVIWISPDGSSTSTDSLIVYDAGHYDLIIIGNNGCRDTLQYIVEDRTQMPSINATLSALNCLSDSISASVVTDASHIIWESGSWSDTSKNVNLPYSGDVTLTLTSHTGCDTTIILTPDTDTMSPDISINGTQIDCIIDTAFLFVNTDMELTTSSWTGNNVIGLNITEAIMLDSGWVRINVTALNGCHAVDSIYIKADRTIPNLIPAKPDTLTCVRDEIRLRVINPVDSIEYIWRTPDNQLTMDSMITTRVAGSHWVIAVGTNGCRDSSLVSVPIDTAYPRFSFHTDTITCDQPTAMLQVMPLSDDISVAWILSEGDTTYYYDLNTNMGGQYELVVLDTSNQCQVLEYIDVEVDTSAPYNSIRGVSNIDCANPIVVLSSDDEALFDYWIDATGDTLYTDEISIESAGEYQLFSKGPNGCVSSTMATIDVDTVSPTTYINVLAMPRCAYGKGRLEALPSSLEQYDYHWSGPNIDLRDRLDLSIEDPGEYVLIVTNKENGCSDTDTVIVSKDEGSVMIFSHLLLPNCLNEYQGTLVIDEIVGTEGSTFLSLNSAPIDYIERIDSLDSGSYVLVAHDDLGCADTLAFEVPDVDRFTVDIGEDIFIRLGEVVHIIPEHNFVDQQLDYLWLLNDEVICDTCLLWDDQLLQEGRLILKITDESGCMAQDTISVHIDASHLCYVPNAFSPNNDGINDEFGPYCSQAIEEIELFEIYDRWGSRVYQIYNQRLNSPDLYWNGEIYGGISSNDVYVYVLRCRLITGEIKFFSGELMLIR